MIKKGVVLCGSRKVHGRFTEGFTEACYDQCCEACCEACCEPVPHHRNDQRPTMSSSRPKASHGSQTWKARPGTPETRAAMKIPKSKINPGVHGRFTEGSRKVHGRASWICVQRPSQGPCQSYFLICLLEFEILLVKKDVYIPEPGARNTEFGTWVTA